MRQRYVFYSLFGAREVWRPAPQGLRIDSSGVRRRGEESGNPPDERQVEVCRRFLSRCERTKHPHLHSYGLKHVVEGWADEYVSNGALIEAARREHIAFAVARSGDPNAMLCLSKHSVRARAASRPTATSARKS